MTVSMATRLVSVLGLGFGDCGKGLFVDALCRQLDAHTVVRFNGGAQAAHNVVLPDGRHHTFSQFGAGSFNRGVYTLLAYPVIVHPTALLVEHDYLRRAGVEDGLDRLIIDARCRLTTPFHQAAGRMRELARADGRHGSCGVGVGETVRLDIARPELTLRYGDLTHRAHAPAKLEAIRRDLLAAFAPLCPVAANDAEYQRERAVLNDAMMARHWLDRSMELVRIVPPARRADVARRLQMPGAVVFEGAQGILLDEWRGFHPHTTWSTIHPSSVQAVAADAGLHAKIHHLGALRSYLTRHGDGPLPTHDTRLTSLPEPHNASGGWQGAFRRAHPDAVLLRYALSVAGRLDGLAISHLDVFGRAPGLRWCNAYAAPVGDGDGQLCERDADGRITELRASAGHDLAHQAALTKLLHAATPVLDAEPVADAGQFIEQMERLTRLPVVLAAFGPTFEAVKALRPLWGSEENRRK
ncbi:adenylosuccinate synthase [Duganella sp. CF517]|uniref:adenylosuccinate synthetase n=1 Tax=Duganella sp. CF517 TaxID=1881038 RepID=UPI0008C5CDA7|nr:adenylosuccinate synthetase [Duganella sp. CF517]SEO37693.1 adenylosuccinate synthase [Duganella sp. CF517]